MCLGIPARITGGDTGHPDLAAVDMGGVTRVVNIGLLDEPPQPGEWILVHMGFALSTMTAEEAADAMAALGAEREAEDREAEDQEAARREAGNREAAGQNADDLQALLDAVDREVAEREAARGAQ
jgi:hydrogenase expression/formation protein HypC